MKTRKFNYFILGGLCFLIPNTMMFIISLFTLDRAAGITNAGLPSIFLVPFIYGLLFVTETRVKKVLISAALAFFSLAIILLLFHYNLYISIESDTYGSQGLSIMVFLVSVVIWEVYHQIRTKLIAND